MMAAQPRLGIDIGKVIINGPGHPGGGDTAFFEGDEAALLATPEMEGVFDSIRRLNVLLAGRVWLASKCGARVQARSLRWLDAHDFYRRTDVARDHVRFCLTRPDKRPICEELRLTHFVDDPEVHDTIPARSPDLERPGQPLLNADRPDALREAIKRAYVEVPEKVGERTPGRFTGRHGEPSALAAAEPGGGPVAEPRPATICHETIMFVPSSISIVFQGVPRPGTALGATTTHLTFVSWRVQNGVI